MFTVLFSEEAMEDLEIAVDFYNNISVELGKKFIQNFDDASLQLETNPFFQIRYDEMRSGRSRNSRFYCISLLLQTKP